MAGLVISDVVVVSMNIRPYIAKAFNMVTAEDVELLKRSMTNDHNIEIIKVHQTYENTISVCENRVKVKDEAISALTEQLSVLELDNNMLRKTLEPNPLEVYWNTKRVSNDQYTYPCRTVNNDKTTIYAVDPRIFLPLHDSKIPVMSGTSDEIALKAQRYVVKNMRYVADKDPFEYWQFPYETLNLKLSDCEDGSLLMANIMLQSGVPYWRIRVNAGNVLDPNISVSKSPVGHAYVTYLRESDNKWYLLDWCYWPDESKDFKLTWKQAEGKYFDIWFSFSQKHIYLSDKLDRVVNK
jgi:hypothetical protein